MMDDDDEKHTYLLGMYLEAVFFPESKSCILLKRTYFSKALKFNLKFTNHNPAYYEFSEKSLGFL